MQREPQCHEVGGLRLEQVLGHAGIGDPPRHADRDLHASSHGARQGSKDTLWHLHRLGNPPVGFVHARRDVDERDAGCLQVRHDLANIRQGEPALLVLITADSIEQGHIGPDGSLNGGNDLEGKTKPAVEVPAVLVVALVAIRRKERAQQIAVRTVYADEVASSLDCALGGRREARHDLGDGFMVERARGGAAGTDIRHRRRGPRLQATHLGMDDAASVVQFGADPRPVPLDRGDEASQLRNEIVRVEAHLEFPPLAPWIDIRGLGVHQSDATAGACLEVVDVPLGNASFGRTVVPLHGRADDPVADLEGTDLPRAKEAGKPHGRDSSSSPGRTATKRSTVSVINSLLRAICGGEVKSRPKMYPNVCRLAI